MSQEKIKDDEYERYAKEVEKLVRNNFNAAVSHIRNPGLEGITFGVVNDKNKCSFHYHYVNEKGEDVRKTI